jgi:hypothetical protein
MAAPLGSARGVGSSSTMRAVRGHPKKRLPPLVPAASARAPAAHENPALALQRKVGNRMVARALGGERRPVGRTLQRVAWSMSADHDSAVKALAKASAGWFSDPEPSGPFGSSPLDQDSAKAITLWGHTGGQNDSFGGFTPAKLVEKLVEYGLRESGHTTLNLITCACNATESRHVQTYAQSLQDEVNALKLGRAITVRTHPMAPEGNETVLYRHEAVQKVAYVIVPGGKLGDVDLVWKIATGASGVQGKVDAATAWSNFVSRLRDRGYTVIELKFSALISSLEPVVEVKNFKGAKSDLTEMLLPDVFGGK